ncbi:hypothetical protein ACLOJK_031264 [Asimina triloba]
MGRGTPLRPFFPTRPVLPSISLPCSLLSSLPSPFFAPCRPPFRLPSLLPVVLPFVFLFCSRLPPSRLPSRRLPISLLLSSFVSLFYLPSLIISHLPSLSTSTTVFALHLRLRFFPFPFAPPPLILPDRHSDVQIWFPTTEISLSTTRSDTLCQRKLPVVEISLSTTRSDKCKRGLAEMIIVDEDPYKIVEHEVDEIENEKTETDRYLEEHIVAEDDHFNILEWWKINRYKFKIRSKSKATDEEDTNELIENVLDYGQIY